MDNGHSNQPLTHWSQLSAIFLLPGLIQGAAFYLIAEGADGAFLNWRLFALWFVVIAPTCVYLISVPNDRVRSLVVSVALALFLSTLLYLNAKDASIAESNQFIPPPIILLSVVCTLIVVFIVLPFYRTKWQRGLPFSHYSSLFEYAWDQSACVLIGLAFTGLVASLVGLTVALFGAVNLSLGSLVYDTPFLGAWVGAAFATAIGITRQSDAVVLPGARTLQLALLHILLPVMLPIVVVFVGIVLVTGVDKLDTGLSITLIVIAAAVVSIVLVSSQVGDAEKTLSKSQQLLSRIMAAMVLPLSLLALHALWFRVAQHGWTGTRVMGAVVVVLCVLYGLGYLIAAFRNLRGYIPFVNRWMAAVCATVAVLLLTPVLDPDRIGVRSQLLRFNSGETTAEKIDLFYLKFNSGRVGREALEALSATPEANKPPLDQRLAELATVNDQYDMEFSTMTPEQQKLLEQAVQGGSLRLLEEQAVGWVRLTNVSELPEGVMNDLMMWSFYEINEYCFQELRDCAYLKSASEANLMAVRRDKTDLSFFLLPKTPLAQVSDESPDVQGNSPIDEVGSDDFEPFPDSDFDELFPPSFPQQFSVMSNGQVLTASDIEQWFAALDQGKVPMQTVEVHALSVGPFRVLRSGAVFIP